MVDKDNTPTKLVQREEFITPIKKEAPIPYTDSPLYFRGFQNNPINQLAGIIVTDKEKKEAYNFKSLIEAYKHEVKLDKAQAEILGENIELKPAPVHEFIDYRQRLDSCFYVFKNKNLNLIIDEDCLKDIKIDGETHATISLLLHYWANGHTYGEFNNGVIVNIDDYADMIGEKNKSRAGKKLDRILNNIAQIKLVYIPSKQSKFDIPFESSILSARPLLENESFIKNKNAYVGFTPEFLSASVKAGFTTLFLRSTLRASSYRNPNTYHIGTAIAINRRKNENKPRAHRMRIDRIIEQCPHIPTIEEVREKHANKMREKIIDVFLRDASVLEEINYHIADEKGNVWDESEDIAIEDFMNLYLVIDEWIDYPLSEKELDNIAKTKKRHREKALKIRAKKPSKKKT